MSAQLKYAFEGDVICFRVFSQVVIVLCSFSAIKDLLEKRGEIYSERPTLPILEMYAQYHFYARIIIRDKLTIFNLQDRNGLDHAKPRGERVLA